MAQIKNLGRDVSLHIYTGVLTSKLIISPNQECPGTLITCITAKLIS